MPNEKPTKEEIKKIMDKARVASEKKEPTKEKPEPEVKKEPPVETKEPLAVSLEREKSNGETPPEDSEKIALRESVKVLSERMKKLEATLGQFIAQATAGNPSQETVEQQEPKVAAQEGLTPEEEVAMLQDGENQGAKTGQGEKTSPPGNTMYMYLLGKTLDAVGKVLPAALQRGGGGGGEGSEGISFSKLAEELLIGQIKRQITGGGGDQNISIDQMKTMANFQGMLLGNFFNTLKNLPKPMAEKIIEGAIKTPGGTKETIE